MHVVQLKQIWLFKDRRGQQTSSITWIPLDMIRWNNYNGTDKGYLGDIQEGVIQDKKKVEK